MTQDWLLWALHGLIIGTGFAVAVVKLKTHKLWVKILEAGIGLALVAGLVCGLTGLWWLWRPIGLAYLVLGGPMVVAVLIAAVMARGEERGEIERITGSTPGNVRDPGVRSGNGGSLCEPGNGADQPASTPAWIERGLEHGFKSTDSKPGRN
jgi:hypothetical protein